MCPSPMLYPTLLVRPVQPQFLIRCHWALWPKHKPKILYQDWSFHTYIRGKNQRAQSFQKLDAKQYVRPFNNFSYVH